MPKKRIIVGSRKSRLSLIQTNLIIRALKEKFPEYEFKIKTIISSGDKLKSLKLTDSGIKGVFVKELEEALISGKIDCAVHSAKDLLPELPKGLWISAIYKRGDPRDALISKNKTKLKNIREDALIGTSSPRRKFQLSRIRQDLKFCDLRGSIETRIKKLNTLKYDAIIVAYVALRRLKIANVATQIFNTYEVLPAAGQGALAVEIRKSDKKMKQILEKINDPDSYLEFKAEKSFLKTLGVGCHNPVAVLAKVRRNELNLTGLLGLGGRIIKDSLAGKKQKADIIGRKLAKRLLCNGANRLL